MTYSVDPEDKDKKPEDFTVPELLEMLDELSILHEEEIAELKKKLEENQND